MIMMRLLLSIVFCLGLSLLLPACRAHIGEMDDVWAKRAEEARAASLEAYHPYPDELTDDTNKMVHQAMDNNSTRRHLRKYTGACLATNPIDRCWRCRPNWANNRKRLAKCALGFGRKTVGGKFGNFYVVTDSSDNDMVNPKPGTLRHAVIQNEPLWIIFARDMIIRLNEELIMTGHKTIDARGSNVHIAHGAGITIQYVKNVILHGLHIHDISVGSGGLIRDSVTHYGFRTQSDGDGVSIYGSTNVWIDHLSMSNCKDGLIDTIEGSTAITISNNHFTNHNEVMLMGASDANSADAIMQITVAFNHFGRGLIQRMPRCRWGFFHVLNNDYTHWLMYAVGGSNHPTIISQGNRYIAPPDIRAKEVTKRDYAPESEWMKWTWRSEGDLLMNGAFFRQSGSPRKRNQFSRQDLISAKPGSYVSRLTRFSGSLVCKMGLPC
ncbi:probable pectate lyase P59 [Aristolochia californica]|uniref:probable pectate lyase P59 n=1 Tax=Aristolochia californica TaxID=171875 RepID=UPI0035E2AD3E